MTTPSFLLKIIDPLFTYMALTADIAIPVSDNARVIELAIAGQETDWKYRLQMNGGPARSYWQFEKGGGLAGIMKLFPAKVSSLCNGFDIPYNMDIIFEAMAWHDPLAAGLARILLWSDPRKLPEVGDEKGAWQYYLDTWRPGMPHPEKWAAVYAQSLSLVKGKQ